METGRISLLRVELSRGSFGGGQDHHQGQRRQARLRDLCIVPNPAKFTLRLAVFAILIFLISACVNAEAPPETTVNVSSDPTPSTAPTTTTPPATTSPQATPSTTSHPPTTNVPTTSTSTTTSETVATDSLPGEPSEFGPIQGAALVVVGVAHDDVLNVRDAPSGDIVATLGLLNPYVGLLEVREMPSGEVLATPESWADAIVATGRTRTLPTTTWYELQAGGLTGWSSAAYLAQLGTTADLTAHIIELLGERPQADTLLDLGATVAETLATDEPTSRVVVSVAPIVFEALGEITIDVLNVGDDSVFGFRLDIFAHAGDDWMSEDPGPFTLRSVESTVLCYADRGVTEDGFCL